MEQIKTIFTEYLKKENTQYAILLNGAWGSGKTYFWKNELS
ncbi:MAG: P-loop NTPase fold protein, partial [Microcystis sp.]